MIVGVLALQGDFAEHIDVLGKLKVSAKEIRTVEDLTDIDRLIIPGGESTVIGMHLKESGLLTAIKQRIQTGMPVFGTCAGIIVLAKKITSDNVPPTLGLLDVTVKRNAYGTQAQSFHVPVRITGFGRKPVVSSFIRAPKITRVGANVHILAEHDDSPVLVREGSILAATFHTELFSDTRLHRYFLSMK